MRITKDRETRKAELVDASIALFLEKGFEATMVSDVVKRVGVAQGTFYYYFATKEDVLDAALGKLLQESVDRMARLALDQYQSTLEKLEGFFRMLFSPRGSVEVNARYGNLLNDPVVHARMQEVRYCMLHGVLRDLLVEGAYRAEFPVLRHPDELAEMALRGASAFMSGRQEARGQAAGADGAFDALEEFMENLLGLPEGTLDFRDKVIRRHEMIV